MTDEDAIHVRDVIVRSGREPTDDNSEISEAGSDFVRKS